MPEASGHEIRSQGSLDYYSSPPLKPNFRENSENCSSISCKIRLQKHGHNVTEAEVYIRY